MIQRTLLLAAGCAAGLFLPDSALAQYRNQAPNFHYVQESHRNWDRPGVGHQDFQNHYGRDRLHTLDGPSLPPSISWGVSVNMPGHDYSAQVHQGYHYSAEPRRSYDSIREGHDPHEHHYRRDTRYERRY